MRGRSGAAPSVHVLRRTAAPWCGGDGKQPGGGGPRWSMRSSAYEPLSRAAGLRIRSGWATPRLSSVLSVPTRMAETSGIRARRISSPTEWIRIQDDRPAVSSTAALVAQVRRCSAPSEGSMDARVSSTSADLKAASGGASAWPSADRCRACRNGPTGTMSSRRGHRHGQLSAVHRYRVDAGLLDPQQAGGRCARAQIGHDDLLAFLHAGDGQGHQ